MGGPLRHHQNRPSLRPERWGRARIGVTRQTIAAIETGKYPPSSIAAFRIADVFGKDLQEVFQWER
ncbi:MAG: helix-turn-helix domain-containing protein [Deltaproteobacteria bacterium]|nr:helix-turn-helix domain-containing protein [Deltaproteobacteria bacterium]